MRIVWLALIFLGAAACKPGGAAPCTHCPPGGGDAAVGRGGGGNGNGGNGTGADGGACGDGCADLGRPAPSPSPSPGALPRVVAYVNCLCGFGVGADGGACLATPDPAVNHVKAWEDAGRSPITHYVISFLSFQGDAIQPDPGAIWAHGGGTPGDFALHPNLKAALASAQAHGKKIFLSLGGEVGSSGFLAWWRALGKDGMRARLDAAVQAFEQQNGLVVDGIDVDIELGGVYQYGSDKYVATRDLINAVPDRLAVAFVPQIGNGLCAAPVVGDPLPPPSVLGGQCQQPVNGDDSPWVLARLDKECTRADGSPRLDYFGIQYYNAGQAECCGGGSDAASMLTSTVQSYVNLANGWPASGDTTDPANPWHQWAYYPGPWAAFGGIGPERLVLGKPGCQGCAGSDYLSLADMQQLLARLDGKLAGKMGGVLFWDLCRLFGNVGPQCVSGQCQPSWGGADVLGNLTTLRDEMAALRPKS